jgi:hypothetical protein
MGTIFILPFSSEPQSLTAKKTKQKKKKNRKIENVCLSPNGHTHKRRRGIFGTSRGQHCMAMAPPTFLLLCQQQQQQQLGVKIVFSPTREKKRR